MNSTTTTLLNATASAQVTLLGQMIANIRMCNNYIALIVLIPSGLLGNLISVIVYSRKAFRETAMGKYLIALSISDFIYQTYGISIYIAMRYSQLSCQIAWIANVGGMVFNSLMNTSVSVDRLVLVRFPTKCHFIKKTWFQCCVIGACFVIAYGPIMAAQHFIKYEVVRNKLVGCYVALEVISQTAITVTRSSNLYLGHLVPFIAMTISGISILRKIFEMKSKSNKSSSGSNSRERVLTIYTVSHIVYFLTLSSLYTGVLLYQIHFYNPSIVALFEPYIFSVELGHLLKNVEINTSFFFYVVFNKLYRGELILIVRTVLNVLTCRRLAINARNGD